MGTKMVKTNMHAVYLLENGSRNGYANEFQYIIVYIPLSGCLDDIILTSNYKDSCLMSRVANYLRRPL